MRKKIRDLAKKRGGKGREKRLESGVESEVETLETRKDAVKRVTRATKTRIAFPKKQPTTPEQAVRSDIFWPDRLDHVRAIAMQGLSDDEMAVMMGITPKLLDAWKEYYPTFAKAVEAGRTEADIAVLRALHRNAVGFEHESDEVVRTRNGADVVTVKRYYAPDTSAQKFWLQNRQREHWNSGNTVKLTGSKSEPVTIDGKIETKMDVVHSILNMIVPQPDGDGEPPKLVGRKSSS